METITAYNLVVDSNVESPSTNGPSAAHMGVKIYNDGPTALTDVYVKMGDLITPATSSGTPATFPSRTVSQGGYSGTFALAMPGGSVDAVRYIPRIEPGEYVAQYFFITYPLKDGSGNAVTGAASDPNDDLWLNYDIWAYANDGATTRRVDETTKVTMRNEISAMANKIWPNSDGKVPDEYLDAIESSLGWRPDANEPRAGTGVRLEGIWYDMGNVGAGFDNNGDGLPDRNAWMQPVGDPNPALFNPLAVRLVKCYGLVVVKLTDGTDQLIPFEDQLYFENIPGNNRGAVGLVYYEFMPLLPNTSTTLSPYQEVASGNDNEKFNGDYGTPAGSFTSTPPDVSFDKNGDTVLGSGTTATWTLAASNRGGEGIGLPGLSLPLIFEDTIPASLLYVTGSATASNSPPAGRAFVVTWSTDGGATWATTEPASAAVQKIRWTLDGPLDSGATALVQFQASIPVIYNGATLDNTACLKLGETGNLGCDSFTTLISGINSLGDLVWKDDDRDSIKDAGETGIANVGVSLYYDADGDGVLDVTDLLYGTTVTNGSGIYSFANLPDAKFIVVVDDQDTDIPPGYTLPDSVTTRHPIDLDSAHASAVAVTNLTADWPFIAALVLTKSVTPTTYGAGELISYTIDLENFSTAVPPPPAPEQISWSTAVTGNRPAQNAANAQGVPDTVVARLDWAASADNLATNGLTFSNPTGSITKVEYVLQSYLDVALVNDQLDIQLDGALFQTLTTAQLNAWVGGAPVEHAIDITSKFPTWSWAQVLALTTNARVNKTNAGDGSRLWVDSIGIRVTTTAGPPPSGTYGPTTIDPLPLTDTFDNTKLQFVSATPPETSVSGGTITWTNAGPLNPGQRKTINVVFRALTPPDIDADNEPDPTTTINAASAANAYFVNGRRTNDATSNVTVTINPRGEIGDFVYWDLNANGVHNVGEPPLTNVRVTLTGGLETLTDSNGFYIFRSLVDGTYTVTIDTTTLPGFTQTDDPDATMNNASTVTINNNNGVSTDDKFLDRDFGYDSALNLISGYIFQDNDGDRIQDPGENFLSGVTVSISGGGSTTTNASGYYQFASLANNTYTITVTQPGSTTQTLDPDVTVNNATTITATGGNIYPNNNFAYQPTGTFTLGDTLYIDGDADGAQDVGETGIPNITVYLYEDADADGIVDIDDALIGSQVTNAAGFYQFTALPADDYIVIVNTLDAQFPASVTQTDDYDASLDSRGKVALAATVTTTDFGYAPTGTGHLGDVVFHDNDGDGVKDLAESGIPNITIALWWDMDANGSYETFISSTSTNASGAYLFSNLPDGDFEARLDTADPDLPIGLVNTTPVTQRLTLAGGIGTKLNGTATPSDSSLRVDFGFSMLATIGDYVFFDANNNATQDYTEAGIPNVTVQLWSDPNEDGDFADGALIDTTTTADGTGADPAGFYRFTDVTPGYYIVKVVPASLPQFMGNPIAQTGDPDRDGVPADDNSYPLLPPADHADSFIIVNYGANYAGADFGYQPAGVLGDFVWFDLDQDGVQDPGEPGIANVAVRLTDGFTTYNVTTDSNGEWSVSNVADGTWTVSVLASNFNAGGPLENTANSFDADGTPNSTVSVTLTNGDLVGPLEPLDLDFGYALSGSRTIAGTVVIHDTGVVGTADDPDIFAEDGTDFDLGPADEMELGGVPVYLYISDGASGWDFIGSTLTDSNGAYSFSGLPDDDYRVIISTTATPLNNATLTTTAVNAAAINPEVTALTNTGTSVMQFLTLSGADVDNVDYAFLSNVDYDFGDLPTLFSATTLAQDGARHTIPGGGSTLYFGTAPDTDLDGVPNSLAASDDTIGSDDETGVTPLNITSWTNGTVGSGNGGDITIDLTVPVGGAWLVGYMDFNQDGDFLDAGELILNQAVATSGSSAYAFSIPAGTIDGTNQSFYSRFRIFDSAPSLPAFAYEGEATDGEVEDYLFSKPVGASIGNFVWVDADGDGIFDNTEYGLGGLTVNLTGDATATLITSDGAQDVDNDGIIDERGYYRFTNLAAGNYTVSFTAPAGYTPSYDEDGGTASPNTSTPVTLASGNQHLTTDFGLEPLTASINGQVRNDTDSDGELPDPDSGIPYVIVQLWTDPNGDGNPADGVQVGETLTDSNGQYQFQGFPTGSYVVVELDPTGATSTADTSSPNDNFIPVALIGGTDNNGNDFLDHMGPTHSISGFVYEDGPSDDNTFGPGDVALPYVLVSLYRDINNSGAYESGEPLLAQQLTNASGAYSFSGLADANYLVIETNPIGAVDESDTQGSLTDNTILVVLAAIDSIGNNFLDDGIGIHSISGHVFHDYPSDDVLDGNGEVPISGVTVRLYVDLNNNDVQDGGDMLIGTTTTNALGLYTFTGITPGNYVVLETDPVGATSIDDITGDDVDNNVAVTITTANSTGNDFLDDNPNQPGSITGTVLADTDNDNDGDTPINIVTLTLCDGTSSLPVDNPNVTGTQDYVITTTDGTYAFTSLVPGSYVVKQTQPNGYATVTDLDSITDTSGSPADPANSNTTDNRLAAIVQAGETDSGNDFIEEQLAAMGNFVWNDADNDGSFDSVVEDPINGVLVRLDADLNGDGDFADAGETGIATDTTDTTGAYNFTDVAPGSYRLVIPTPPAGYAQSSSVTDTADNREDNDDNGTQTAPGGAVTSPLIVLSAGETDNTVDFGFLSPKGATYAGWQIANPLGGQNGPAQNPDSDRYSNFLEYAFCMPPGSGSNTPFCLLQTGALTANLEYTRLKGGTDVTYSVQTASTLGTPTTWSPLSGTPNIVDNGNGTETVTYTNVVPAGSLTGTSAFYRIAVTDTVNSVTYYTELQGWLRHDIVPGCETLACPLLPKAKTTGAIGTVTGQVLDLSASLGSTDLTTILTAGASYYLEITNGDNEGHRFDIDARTATTITLANDSDLCAAAAPYNTKAGAAPANLTGDSFAIYAHRTVAGMFPAANYQSGNSLSTADRILIKRGSAWDIYWLYTNGAGPAYWDLDGDGSFSDMGADVLPANQGLFVHKISTDTEATLCVGEVRSWDYCAPLCEVDGCTLLAPGYPVDMSPAEMKILLSDGWDGDADPTQADKFILWNGDSGADSGYTCYWLADAGPYRYWTVDGDFTLPNKDAVKVFQSTRNVFLMPKTAKPNWCQPVPFS